MRIRLELEDGADYVSPDDFSSQWVPPVESQWQVPLLWNSLRPGAEPSWINEYPVLALPAPTEGQTTNRSSDQETALVLHPRFSRWRGVWGVTELK